MKRLSFVGMLAALLLVFIQPLAAQAAAITVTGTWSPAVQLTTLDNNYPNADPGDDYRLAQMRLEVTTNVEFWAVELACTFPGTVLDSYTHDRDGNLTPAIQYDNRPPLEWTALYGQGFTEIHRYSTTAAGLQVTDTASLMGGSSTIGRNGQATTFQLGLMNVLVRPAPNPAVAFSSLVNRFTCTVTFLDRSGRNLVPPVTIAPPTVPLTVISGYTVSGRASYQARTTLAGIGVRCDGGTPQFYTAVTDATGIFRLVNIRENAFLNCRVFGNVTDPAAGQQPDIYLAQTMGFDLNERGSYNFPPSQLRAGNLDRLNLCGGNQCINEDDLFVVTTNWQQTAAGDVNGDGRTDRADLAIVAGNMNENEIHWGRHVVYSLPRLWAQRRESRIWLGTQDSGDVTQLVPTAAGTIDLWASVSPDGSQLAFIRKTDGTATTPARYELFRMALTGATPAAPVAILTKTQAGGLDAFAPSWSRDGTRIAFVCSAGYGSTANTPAAAFTGYGTDSGALCVVDATGRNFRQLTGPNTVKIFPPVWEGDWIIFGATTNLSLCSSSLCVYDIGGNWLWRLDDDIPGAHMGSGLIADMPVMQNGWLFYRYTSLNPAPDSGSSLRVITMLDRNCNPNCDFVQPFIPHPPAACPGQPGNDATTPRPTYLHTNIVFDSDPGPACNYRTLDANPNMLDAAFTLPYYEVEVYGWGLMFPAQGGFVNPHYRWDLGIGDPVSGPCADGNPGDGDSDECFPEWQPVTFDNMDFNRVDGMVGDWYQPPFGNHTLAYAERNTVDWTP